MKELTIEYSLYKDGKKKIKIVNVKDDAEANVVAAIHRPPYGTIHGVFDKEGKLLYTDEQDTLGDDYNIEEK